MPTRGSKAVLLVKAGRDNNRRVVAMLRIILLPLAIWLATAAVAAAALSSGTYPVDIYQGERTYKANWMIRVEGAKITGMSDWKPLYGHRQFIQPLKGSVSADQVSIVRNCAEPDMISCQQTYTGTITGNSIEGGWSGTGGSGSWKLYLNSPLR